MTLPEGWPAAAEVLDHAEKMMRAWPRAGRVAVVSDGDTDGLCAGALALAALDRTHREPQWIIAHRREHPHTASLRARIAAASPSSLIVLDMGSRAGAIVAGLPTIVVDHHAPGGVPDSALLVTAYGHPPVAPASLLAYHLFARVAPLADLEWLAILGTYADQGDAALPGLAEGVKRHGRAAIAEASALLNAARRAADPEPELAGAVLRSAKRAADIARGDSPEINRLRELRASVNAEVARCGRAAPRFAGQLALVRIRSRAQVHPLLASRWASRLPRFAVIVANDGYLPGRVNFAMRTQRPIDLVALLRGLGLDLGSEFGHGHPGATGGSVTAPDFEGLLNRLGFGEGAQQPAL